VKVNSFRQSSSTSAAVVVPFRRDQDEGRETEEFSSSPQQSLYKAGQTQAVPVGEPLRLRL
jgi:hypothetical protein